MDIASAVSVVAELEAHVASGRLQLPVLPAAVVQLLALARRDDADARMLAEHVRRDAALAANVLRAASSAFYSRGEPLKSLPQAIGRVGINGLRQIALVVGGAASVFRVAGHDAAMRRSFQHAFATALFAQEVARVRRESVEEAFLAGLFHDVGKPVLLAALVDLKLPVDACAMAAVDAMHARVGSALIGSWKLAPAAELAARHHHDEAPPPAAAGWAHLVALADALAHHALDGDPAPEKHRALAPLEIYPEDLEALVAKKDRIAGAVKEIA